MARRPSKSPPRSTDSTSVLGLWPYAAPLALVWLVGFGIYVLTAPLQNNGRFDRLTVALLLPDESALLAEPDGIPSGVRFLPQRFDLMAVALLVAAGTWGIGGIGLRSLAFRDPTRSLEDLSRVERTACAFGLGLSLWSLLTLAFGLAGWLSRPLFIAVSLVAFTAELLLSIKDWQTRPAASSKSSIRPAGRFIAVCVAIAAPFLLLAALAAMLPPFDFDVKEYHLGGPKEWFLDGQVRFLPHNVYTSFPALTEMLSLSAMVVRGDWYRGALAGQLVLAGFLPLTCVAIYAISRRLFGATAGACGALIYATTPWSYRIAVIAYAEGGLTCFLALSLLAAVLSIQRIVAGRSADRLVLLTGVFAGSAMSCKYPGVIQAVIPIGVALFASTLWKPRTAEGAPPGSLPPHESSIKRFVAIGVVYALSVLLAVGPWLVKNVVETRNPVYPLLWSVFDGRDWDASLNAKWNAAHSPAHYLPTSFFQEMKGVAVTNDWQSMLVFGFAPLAFLGARRRSAAAICTYLGFLYAAWWMLTHRIDRFWVPLLPVACVLAGAGAAWAEDLPERLANRADGEAFRRLWRYGAGGIAGLAILFNLGFVTTPLTGNPHYLADLDAVAKSVATPSLALLHDRLPADSKVLLVGEAEIFDSRFPVVYNTVFDHNIFEEWTAEPIRGQSPEAWPLRPAKEIRRTLAEHGVTHIYVNWREILRYRTTYGFTRFVTPKRFKALIQARLLDQPRRFFVSDFDSLDHAQQKEASSRFTELINGDGDDRTFTAGELYKVIPQTQR